MKAVMGKVMVRIGVGDAVKTNKTKKSMYMHKTKKREHALWTSLATQLVFFALIDLNYWPKGST